MRTIPSSKLSLCFALILLCRLFIPGSVQASVSPSETSPNAPSEVRTPPTLAWNVANTQLPLVDLPEQLGPDFDSSFTYPLDQFGFPLFQTLYYNPLVKKYLLMLLPRIAGRAEFLELHQSGTSQTFVSNNGPQIQLSDIGGQKRLRTVEGNEYTFTRLNDGEFHCVQIRDRSGVFIHLNYTNDGLIDSLNDSGDRSITFDYSLGHIASVSQTWTSEAIRKTKTWRVKGYEKEVFAHANFSSSPAFGAVKAIPRNAITLSYTPEMANCDRMLASIFGGPGAVAAANGFEPAGLANQYPIYRGDVVGDDGVRRHGHLSYAMHLYGSPNGTADTALFVPTGFTSHSNQPTPTDAAVTFYYPHLGNLNSVTVAVFHVANFAISYESGRVRIGNIGGRGGSYAFYKHSHVEFYRGNTGLPPGSARESLRIDPAAVFGITSATSRLRVVAANNRKME